MKKYIKDNQISPSILYLENQTIINPTEELYIAAGFIAVEDTGFIAEEPEQTESKSSISYSALVNLYIREKYSLSDELAILRQQDVKEAEYQEYFDFCEDCKKRAKEYLNITDSSDAEL